MHTAVNKAMQVGKATMLAIGVGVSFALVLGLATVALAAVPGDPFKLGKVNVINNATTTLQGSGLSGPLSSSVLQVKRDGATGGPALTVDNASSSSAARGIDINVPFRETPINVNSSAGKSDLNVDKLDGQSSNDFLPNDTYVVDATKVGPGGSDTVFASADGDPGDKLLGGGGTALSPNEDTTTASVPFINGQGWDYQIRDNGDPSSVEAFALCADFSPEH